MTATKIVSKFNHITLISSSFVLNNVILLSYTVYSPGCNLPVFTIIVFQCCPKLSSLHPRCKNSYLIHYTLLMQFQKWLARLHDISQCAFNNQFSCWVITSLKCIVEVSWLWFWCPLQISLRHCLPSYHMVNIYPYQHLQGNADLMIRHKLL
jgi:hypothetical protein